MKIEIPEDALRSVALPTNGIVAHGSQKPRALSKVILRLIPSRPVICWYPPLMGIMTRRTGKISHTFLFAVPSEYGRVLCSPLVEAHDIGYQFSAWMEGHRRYFLFCHVSLGMTTGA